MEDTKIILISLSYLCWLGLELGLGLGLALGLGLLRLFRDLSMVLK